MASKPDKDLVIAALMHDAVEDQSDQLSSLSGVEDRGTGIEEGSLAEIKTKYGERTANIVSHLSNPDFTMALESQGISKKDPRYQEFKNKLYADHVQEIVEDPDVLTIKLADFSENALSLDALPVETDRQKLQKQKFLDKYTPVMKIFIDRLQRDNLFPVYQQKLLEKYNQYTQN
jgi:(p)ppGpp synthase/HD superfamily hydrolase